MWVTSKKNVDRYLNDNNGASTMTIAKGVYTMLALVYPYVEWEAHAYHDMPGES